MDIGREMSRSLHARVCKPERFSFNIKTVITIRWSLKPWKISSLREEE